jgi:putative heme-binding domain-containing protein
VSGDASSKTRFGARAVVLAVIGVALVVVGAAVDRGINLAFQRRVTIETGPDPALLGDKNAEWERLFEGGDPAAGERLFFDPNLASRCGVCHAFKGRGEQLAPNLTGAGGLPLRQLLRDIVDPRITLRKGYESVTVFTKDGRVISGWKHGDEHLDRLWVRREDGTVVEIAMSDVEERSYDTAMPKNYAELLTIQDFRDLIALLRAGVKQNAPKQQEPQQQDQVASQEPAGSP